MSEQFGIRPETRASTLHFLYRQFFVTPPPVLKRDVDLSGKTAIVTGSNGGLGFETARQLLDLGADVILAVRDEAKGHDARKQLSHGRQLPKGGINVWKLDLSSYESIMSFAERAQGLPSLDIAILNAGLFNARESFSSAGYEEDIQINYLSNVLLAVLLLPVIKEKKVGKTPGRIVMVSSDVSAWAKFEERQSEPLLGAFKQKMEHWDMAERYGTSKLLGQLFLTELAQKVSASKVTVVCANPGFCRGSSLGRQADGLIRIPLALFSRLVGRTCSLGARTIVHAAAILGEEAHGHYIEDAKIQPMPPLVYQPEGRRIAELLYEETLDEMSFAGARGIIELLHE
ncbi:hypothetical protein S40288_04298 [Stachybotrys chartarum IBT 40288]|nr:hypothetical protein S40288_04298 [Stachybotrys chartarum IBT 40288]